jgi:O-antigen ligase
VTGALAAVLLIATSAPVSASRAATGMAIALCGIMTAHALSNIFAARRRARLPAWPAAAGLLVLVLASVSAIGWLGSRSINERYIETRKTLATGQSIWGERMAVYRDTWDLASQKPFFGWGLDSYQAAFQLIRPRTIMAARAYEQSYATAHNDWLQSLAETGFAGTTLLVFSIVIPLSRLPRRLLSHPLVAYPLAALGLVLVYACIEFPFSNGAFVITFWILFFATLRHAELTAKISREP